MNPAADLLNFLAALTIAAGCVRDDGHDTDDLADAVESVDFFYLATPGGRLYLPDGRVLVRL